MLSPRAAERPRPTGGSWAAACCSWSSRWRSASGDVPYSEEIVFTGSLAIVAFLIVKLTRALEPEARATLVGTAIVIFVFRAIPCPARA